MKQVLQNLRNGQTNVVDVPAPGASSGSVLIQTRASLISAGTERMLVEFGQASLLGKAKAQPEKVKQVIDKIKTDGLMPTLEVVFSRLDEPLPLGYCNVGTVLEVGSGVTDFAPGDRVISNGPHAEIVCVPRLLCAKIPDNVTDEQATFTVLSSIGLQGIRLAVPTFGETVAVMGMGLIGLVTAQLLIANGCRVLATDINAERLAKAASYGCETLNVGSGGDPIAAANAMTAGRGVDAVLITASAKTDEIVHQAAKMCRKRGRIVLVGVVGLNLHRSDFYEKELTFQVSCSYGPGRYDNAYERNGHDYPAGYVRWTEQRNFEAVLAALHTQHLKVDDLITDRFTIDQAPVAYERVQNDRSALGVILQYPQQIKLLRRITLPVDAASAATSNPAVGVIGGGNFSKMTLMPALAKCRAHMAYVADHKGNAAQYLAQKFGVKHAVTDHRMILDDPAVAAVLIAVGHSAHAKLIEESLIAGKHVFVEKPLAMNVDEVRRVIAARQAHPDHQLMVGFNRRFSPHAVQIKKLLAQHGEPLAMNMTVNAGFIPPDVWVHDPQRGGGRIIGEACHFLDLMVFLTGSTIASVAAHHMGTGVATTDDKMSISLQFEDGSIGTVNYFANGSKTYPKEMLEVFSEQRVLRLDNFRRTDGYGFTGFRKFKTSRQDKGHHAELAAFINHLSDGGPPLIPFNELINVTLASFAAVASSHEHRTIAINREYADVLTDNHS